MLCFRILASNIGFVGVLSIEIIIEKVYMQSHIILVIITAINSLSIMFLFNKFFFFIRLF